MAELRSDLGWSTPSTVRVRGKDLSDEILGVRSFSWMTFFHLTGREPADGEAAVFDALLVTLLEHGPTPSALVARLAHLGAPESLEGAVAAGLLGLGNVFGGSAETASASRSALARRATSVDAISRLLSDMRCELSDMSIWARPEFGNVLFGSRLLVLSPAQSGSH